MGLIPWRPLSATFGAEAEIDLSRPFSPELVDAWRALFDERHLILVRCGALGAAEQKRALSALGKPVPTADTTAFISTDPAIGGLGTIEVAFHSDLSFAPYPLDGICLYGLTLTDDVSSTKWVSAIDAYSALPASLKARIADLEVVNVISPYRCERNRFNGRPPNLPAAAHRLVRRTKTGQPFLYANEAQSDHVVGLAPAESDALLDEIYAALYAPSRILEHRWRKGDLVVWNNQVLQHARGDLTGLGERTLRRFEFGGRTLAEQFPEHLAEIYKDYG
ncbi:MAG: TauD/TfdA family dioxygenase [Caulobacteraceae bacterium]|nr:TauD/TfdA family dioxygenase [Caulobacteraceae bacterium]